MDLRQMGSLALTIVVAAIIISMGAQILDTMQQQQCDYTWGTYSETMANASGGDAEGDNLVTGDKSGCCQSLTNSTACDVWYYDTATNVTYLGLTGTGTFGTWIPLIALMVVAALVIGIITRYIGGAGA